MADNILPPEGQINGGAGTLILNPVESLTGVGSKRQRRPSVRLGDIGVDPPYDSHSRRHPNKPYRPHHQFPSGKPSKTRPLTNLTSPLETLDDEEEPNCNTDTWKLKDSTKKRAPAKRVRSNWVSRIDDGDEKYSAGEDLDDGYREFEVENSESPFRDSMENLGFDGLQKGVELCGPSDTDARDWKSDENRGEDGVRVWLNGLGLGRYAPVFQVHEVDDEVLPMLTLEDLKDMGISAVGTRRKMYCAIQKLGKGFS